MNKEELLLELSSKINTGEISKEEVLLRIGSPARAQTEIRQFSATKMLYILGAAIVVIGIIIFVHQIWGDISSVGRISVTLGLGLLITAIGSVLLKKKPEDPIGSVFHFMGGLLIPGGALVTLYELNINFSYVWPVTITFALILAFYLLLNFVHKTAILTFFAIANGTVFIYLLVRAMTYGALYMNATLYAYLTMAIGISYILLGYSFKEGVYKKLTEYLYFFGSLFFFGAGFSQVYNSLAWQTLYFFLAMAGIFLSVYLKSRAILIISTLFLIIHISYITGKYFANSVGWPIALVVLGFVFIGLGYVSVSINNKYLKK